MKVILPAYRSISWMVKAYAVMHKKYWGASVILLAEEDYSDGQFTFLCPPNEIGRHQNGVFPAGSFSDILAWGMKQVKDKYVLIMLADYLIYKPVDTLRLKHLLEYMARHKIFRGQVGDDGGLCEGEKTDTYKDIDIWEGSFLPTSLTPGIWDRKMLLGMLQRDCASQAMEISCYDQFAHGHYRSIAPSPGIMSYLNVIRGMDLRNLVITEEVYNEVQQFMPLRPRSFVRI